MGVIKLITPPSIDPVSLADVKNYLRVDQSSEDTQISLMIGAATRLCEEYTNKRFITQTWDYFIDRFPREAGRAWQEGVFDLPINYFDTLTGPIKIPLGLIQSVTFLKTYDDSDTEATFSSSSYALDLSSEPARLALRMGAVWPTTILRPVNGIQIRCVVGYGSAATDVPASIRQAILETVASMYEGRGDVEQALPKMAMQLLEMHRAVRFS